MRTVANGAMTTVIVEVILRMGMCVTSRITTVRIISSDMEEELHS